MTARTNAGERASMMALVSPTIIAIGANAATIAARSGIPNDTFEAPSVMLSPNSSCTSEIVSRVRRTSTVSAPMGMARGSIRMSSRAMP